jgi:uncharacterized protein YbaP (TraB family)
MRFKITFFITLFCILFGQSSFAEMNAQSSAPLLQTTNLKLAETTQRRGALYRIRYQGNITYLFGTIHVGMPTFFPLESEVTHALSHATKQVVELDLRNDESFRAAIKKYGMYEGKDTIKNHLSPENFNLLQQVVHRLGISFSRVAQMKPWLIANLLMSLDLERNGYQRSQGIEFFLLSLATAQAKVIEELETADYQLSLFDGMTDTQQEQYLRENLSEINDGNALKKAKLLIDAWGRADGSAFDSMIREAANEKSTSSEFTQRTLLDKRNIEMATKIEVFIKNEKIIFVGVGLLHLLGENSLPKLLLQRGYEVEKLY